MRKTKTISTDQFNLLIEALEQNFKVFNLKNRPPTNQWNKNNDFHKLLTIDYQRIVNDLIEIIDFNSKEVIANSIEPQNWQQLQYKHKIDANASFKNLSKENHTLTNVKIYTLLSLYPTLFYNDMKSDWIKEIRTYGFIDLYMFLYENYVKIKEKSFEAGYTVKFILNGFYYTTSKNPMFAYSSDYQKNSIQKFIDLIRFEVEEDNLILFDADLLILPTKAIRDQNQIEKLFKEKNIRFTSQEIFAKTGEVIEIESRKYVLALNLPKKQEIIKNKISI